MKGLALSVVLVTSLFASEIDANDDKQQLPTPQDCSKIVSDTQRLNCYDNFFKQAVPLASVDTSSPKSIVIEQENTEKQVEINQSDTVKTDVFGVENLRNEDKKQMSSVSDTVISIKKNKLGIRRFTLKNGQVWRETETSRLKIAINEIVVINKGAFSSFYLTTEKSNRRVRVKRIK
ncbi:hypothetical protein [Agaribacter marinus]|uniref:Organic solvent tolerance-like N-terminal domain-containing protein n=1 Tax=Agaribacter marinus TaxID=1431249 RepID=A0AA37SZM6_9ALTE|nr:hypothetical protein [Agaribacter marinus]GLR72351.1 hypothetical protein GCM10007852_32590 [Agaribacter marinus]